MVGVQARTEPQGDLGHRRRTKDQSVDRTSESRAQGTPGVVGASQKVVFFVASSAERISRSCESLSKPER